MYPNRNAFKLQIVPSDRQLWAIGVVAVTWSHLENLLQISAQAIAGDGSAEHRQYSETRSFKIRLDILEALIEARMLQPHRDHFLSLVNDIRNLQVQRDKIVHGAWGGDAVRPDGPQALGAFHWQKPHPPFDWKLDFGGIKAVALRIDDTTARWINAALLGAIGDDPILLSQALQQKLRTPNPTL